MSSKTTNQKPQYLSDGDGEKQLEFRREIYATLLNAYRPFLYRIFLVLVLGLIGRALLLGNTNIIGYWVDSFCTGPDCHQPPLFLEGFSSEKYVWLLLSMTILGLIATLTFRVVFSRLSARAVSSIYDETTLRTSRYSMGFFDSTPAGRIITRFSSDYGNVFRLFGGPLAEFVSIIFDLIMMVTLIAVANTWYLLPVAFIALLNFAVYKLNQKRLRTLRRDLSANRSPSIAHFAETAQGASTIRSFRRIQSFTDRFLRLDKILIDQKLKTTTAILGFSMQMNALTALLFLITGLMAYFLIQNNSASVGSIGVAFTFITLSGNTVQMFFEWLTQFEEALIGLERLDKYIRKDIEPGAKLPHSTQFKTSHPVYQKGEEQLLSQTHLITEKSAPLSIQGLWFRYGHQLPWVLKDINLEIDSGERLGVIGKTGSGKSSLIQAIFHLYPIDKGQIKIGPYTPQLQLDKPAPGTDTVDLQAFRRSVSFISQEPILFIGTLRYNLDINHQFSDEHLIAILGKVGLDEWVRNHPLGLDLKIEERGKNLSLGERQLICMARCLLQDTPVVIMDEATSSVDPQSEEIMVKATDEFFQGKTQIIIAHRLSTLEKCDRVLWIQDGEVKELGPTKEVLREFEKSGLHH